jgi:hypothetical protein
MKTRRWDESAAVEGLHEHKVSLMSKRILIVEDNDLNMKLFRDLLEAHGYATLQSKDGMEEQATRTSHSNFSPARAPGQTRRDHCTVQVLMSDLKSRARLARCPGSEDWAQRRLRFLSPHAPSDRTRLFRQSR